MPSNPKITSQQEATIIEVINRWPRNRTLSWEALCNAVEAVIGYIPTRQALAKRVELSAAFNARKDWLASNKAVVNPLPNSRQVAGKRIAELEYKLEQLQIRITRLLELNDRYLINARHYGMTDGQLNARLSDPKRGSAKSEGRDRE